MSQQKKLKSLGMGRTTYRYDQPDAALLEAFPSPFASPDTNPAGAVGTVHIECPEFTCLCPITGQPDFAKIVLDYQPDRLCIESKSLKLYLWSFRDEGAFHEAVTNRICDDLVQAVKPRWLEVVGDFYVRGGIHTVVTARHSRKPE